MLTRQRSGVSRDQPGNQPRPTNESSAGGSGLAKTCWHALNIKWHLQPSTDGENLATSRIDEQTPVRLPPDIGAHQRQRRPV